MYWLNPGNHIAGSPQCNPFFVRMLRKARLRLTQVLHRPSLYYGILLKGGKPAPVPVPQPLPIGWRPNQRALLAPVSFLRKLPGKTKSSTTFLHNFRDISAASWESAGTVCDLNDYRAQDSGHLSISGWPPRRAKGHSNCHVPLRI